MGVRGLLRYCTPIQKKQGSCQDLRIGVDGFSLMFLFREDRTRFEEYLQSLLKQLPKSITFVMDKRASKEKKVLEERKGLRTKAKEEADSILSFLKSTEVEDSQRSILEKLIVQRERAAWHTYPEYIQWLSSLLHRLNILMVWAKEEADTMLAEDDYDIVISSDSDMLILGVKRLWIPKHSTEITHEDFIQFIGIDEDLLFELAYLAGCDVQPKSHMSIQAAVSNIKFYGSLNNIYKRRPEIVTKEMLEECISLKQILSI